MMKKIVFLSTLIIITIYFLTCFLWGENRASIQGTEVFKNTPPLRDHLLVYSQYPLSNYDKESIKEKELKRFREVEFINEKGDHFKNEEVTIYSFARERFFYVLMLSDEGIYLPHSEPYLQSYDVLYVWCFYKWVMVKKKFGVTT